MDCRAYGYRIKEVRVPTPRSPIPRRYPMGLPIPFGDRCLGIKYSNVRPPVGSLSVLANTIYNQVTNEQEVIRLKQMIYKQPASSAENSTN